MPQSGYDETGGLVVIDDEYLIAVAGTNDGAIKHVDGVLVAGGYGVLRPRSQELTIGKETCNCRASSSWE